VKKKHRRLGVNGRIILKYICGSYPPYEYTSACLAILYISRSYEKGICTCFALNVTMYVVKLGGTVN
jgi:hypothetical protein